MSACLLDVMIVAGARPNFMKVAPVIRALGAHDGVEVRLVHTGQHYDKGLSGDFFADLGIDAPWRNLEVGSASHALQTARIMERFEPVVTESIPDVLVVVGDVNSTIACALVAVKLGIRVVHVEAGLRSFDTSMPEEINRRLTDAISDCLLVSEPSGVRNLRSEGFPEDRIFLTGNVMIDSLLGARRRAEESDILDRLKLAPHDYGVVTLHRPANVDDPGVLGPLMESLADVSRRVPLVFPVHPRTAAALQESIASQPSRLRLLEPLRYLDFVRLMEQARLILTDSGGIQEEACILGVPCLTLRENTERPITLEGCRNRLVGSDPERIKQAAFDVLDSPAAVDLPAPELWDGHAAERVARILVERYGKGGAS